MGFFATAKQHKLVIKKADELARLMLSSRESWQEHARAFILQNPRLSPGILIQVRLAIDDLNITDDARVGLIDQLGEFRDSLVDGSDEESEERCAETIAKLTKAQLSPPQTSPKEMAKILLSSTTRPQEAAVVALDSWNVMARQNRWMDATAFLQKIVRGTIMLGAKQAK